MKIFKVEREDNYGYDHYSDFVCFAEDAQEARYMAPDPEYHMWNFEEKCWVHSYGDHKPATYVGWVDDPTTLKVTELNPEHPFIKPQVVCASFHAG